MSMNLKPCPICGKEVEVSGGLGKYDPYDIHCDCGLDFCTGSYDEKEFEKEWNTRAKEKCRLSKDLLLYATKLKDEYEWLLGLNDDCLAYQVKTRNDVQNALLELLSFTDDVINEYQMQN